MSGHANQNLVSIREKSLLSRVGSKYKNLAKFAEDTDCHPFREKLENSLQKAKESIIVCRHSNLKQTTRPMLHLSKNSMKPQKTTGQPNSKRPMAGHKGTRKS